MLISNEAWECLKWGAPHLRHAKATHLYNNGVSLLSIKKFLGHSSITITEIYATPDSIKIREQIKNGSKK